MNNEETDAFPLDDTALALMAEYDQQQRVLDAARSGTLTLFARQHKLDGNWQLAPNHKELVRSTPNQMQIPAPQ